MPGCQVSQAGEESREPREGPTEGPAPGGGASRPQEEEAASERDRVRRMWLEYRLRGEASQKEKLVGYYMEWFDWIVACNAFRVRCPVEKVRGPGMEALIEAIEEYDPSSCAPFEGFAAEKIKWAIRNAIRDALRPLPRPAGARNPPPDPAKVVEFNELVQELLLACPEDLYCPAYDYERRVSGAVELDRVELFCRAAGVGRSRPAVALPRGAVARARRLLIRHFGAHFGGVGTRKRLRRSGYGPLAKAKGPFRPAFAAEAAASAEWAVPISPLVGLAPYATSAARSWLGAGRLEELCRRLVGEGARLVLFTSARARRRGRDEASPSVLAQRYGVLTAAGLRWDLLAALVAECDLVISADTGPLHLAGALLRPILGLFGQTAGEIVCRPYSNYHVLASRAAPPGCSPPCYGLRSRGYDPELCGREGCLLLRALRVEEMFRFTMRLLLRASAFARAP